MAQQKRTDFDALFGVPRQIFEEVGTEFGSPSDKVVTFPRSTGEVLVRPLSKFGVLCEGTEYERVAGAVAHECRDFYKQESCYWRVMLLPVMPKYVDEFEVAGSNYTPPLLTLEVSRQIGPGPDSEPFDIDACIRPGTVLGSKGLSLMMFPHAHILLVARMISRFHELGHGFESKMPRIREVA